jgi:hypothetical protein
MTDRAKFEAMLEALINEDQETAKDIFHNIVVGKSREIYEELLESDFPPAEEEEEEESEPADDAEDDDAFGGEDDETDDAEDDDAFGGEDDDDDMGGEGDLEDRVMDLEDALEELKAEFDELLAGEESEPEHDDMFGGEEGEEGEEGDEFGGMDDMGGEDDFGADMADDDSEVKEIHHYIHNDDQEMDEGDQEFNQFMEYINKVALPKHGDNGVNNKSVIDNMPNNMGGKVIGRSSEVTTGGTQGGLLAPKTSPQTGGNVNVPGAKSATKLHSVKKGHGTERKGSGEGSLAGAGTGKPQKANTTHKSLIGGKK